MKKRAFIDKKHCVACGSCMSVCPKDAISIKRGMFALVDTFCVGCGLCSKTCPASIIEIKRTVA